MKQEISFNSKSVERGVCSSRSSRRLCPRVSGGVDNSNACQKVQKRRRRRVTRGKMCVVRKWRSRNKKCAMMIKRERRSSKNVGEGERAEIRGYLSKLHEIVPISRKHKRLSKLEVITNAIEYIRELRQTLGLPPCFSLPSSQSSSSLGHPDSLCSLLANDDHHHFNNSVLYSQLPNLTFSHSYTHTNNIITNSPYSPSLSPSHQNSSGSSSNPPHTDPCSSNDEGSSLIQLISLPCDPSYHPHVNTVTLPAPPAIP